MPLFNLSDTLERDRSPPCTTSLSSRADIGETMKKKCFGMYEVDSMRYHYECDDCQDKVECMKEYCRVKPCRNEK